MNALKATASHIFYISLTTLILLTSACFSSGAQKAQKKPTSKNGTTIVVGNKEKSPNDSKKTEFPIGNNTVNIDNGTEEVITPDDKPSITPIEKPKTWNEPANPLEETGFSKPIFNIAMLLPFGSQYFQAENGLDSVPKHGFTALELYEGMLIGLSQLNEMEEALFEVKVFDTGKNPTKVAQILTEENVGNVDLIVGPVYNSSLKVAADFANRQHVYQVSPLSPSNKITVNNPYYLAASPSIETQCASMYDYIVENITNEQIITVCGNKGKEINLANVFSQLHNMQQKNQDLFTTNSVKQFIVANGNEEDLESYLDPEKNNVLVVTSFNELFVNDMIRRIHLLRNKYKITLFGMPKWLNMKTLSLEYLVNLNFHVTAPSWTNVSGELAHAQFQQLYFNQFKTYPSKYAAQGFDLMLYLGKMLQQYGRQFGNHFEEATAVKGLYNEFNFQPASKHQYSSPFYTLDYYENKYVNILRYNKDYVLEKVH